MDKLLSDNSRQLLKKENNFDFIRYFFAITLVIAHFCTLADIDIKLLIPGGTRIRVFFILSGFLVFYSFIRKPELTNYIKKRLRRIYPAYLLVILLCFIGGILLTNLTVKEYLLSTETYKYLGANAVFMNFLQPCLPGVFENNPIQAVNGSLWTMKVEVLFYVSVPIVYYLLKRYNKLIIMVCIFLFSIIYEQGFTYLYDQTGSQIYLLLRKQIGSQFIYFYSGTFILLYFEYFIKYLKYFFPAALLVVIFQYSNVIMHYLEPISMATLIIGFAYNFKYLNFLRKYDNISYGIYLFHFPVIQTIISFGWHETNALLAFLTSLLITVVLAFLSWKYVEKPIIY